MDDNKYVPYKRNIIWASKGFDRDLEAGEASRMVMR